MLSKACACAFSGINLFVIAVMFTSSQEVPELLVEYISDCPSLA